MPTPMIYVYESPHMSLSVILKVNGRVTTQHFFGGRYQTSDPKVAEAMDKRFESTPEDLKEFYPVYKPPVHQYVPEPEEVDFEEIIDVPSPPPQKVAKPATRKAKNGSNSNNSGGTRRVSPARRPRTSSV